MVLVPRDDVKGVIQDFDVGPQIRRRHRLNMTTSSQPLTLSYRRRFFLLTLALGRAWTDGAPLIGGTGKFSGITGSGTFLFDGNSFKTGEQGTYISHGTHNLSYKLP